MSQVTPVLVLFLIASLAILCSVISSIISRKIKPPLNSRELNQLPFSQKHFSEYSSAQHRWVVLSGTFSLTIAGIGLIFAVQGSWLLTSTVLASIPILWFALIRLGDRFVK
jgi:phage baseplate assembly protein gpV